MGNGGRRQRTDEAHQRDETFLCAAAKALEQLEGDVALVRRLVELQNKRGQSRVREHLLAQRNSPSSARHTLGMSVSIRDP
jgi:hypothetical protein